MACTYRLLAGAWLGVALAGCGGSSPAPSAGSLPLTPRARVIASAAGGSDVNPLKDHNHYRYLALSGTVRTPGARLITAQLHSMVSQGWADERSIGFRGTESVARAVPVTSAGAEVLLDSPDHKEYAAMQVLIGGAAAQAQTRGTPLWHNPAIATALTEHRPVLLITLGNGPHS